MPTTSPTIVRILSVTDTREREENEDGRMVPIPGSGDARECDRCNRTHEVHVDVLLSDDSTAVIGSGCARGESMERAVRNAVRTETRRATLAAELELVKAEQAKHAAIFAEVQALPVPEPVELERLNGSTDGAGRRMVDGEIVVWGADGIKVWTLPGQPFDEERRRTFERQWRHAEEKRRGGGDGYRLRLRAEELESKLARVPVIRPLWG